MKRSEPTRLSIYTLPFDSTTAYDLGFYNKLLCFSRLKRRHTANFFCSIDDCSLCKQQKNRFEECTVIWNVKRLVAVTRFVHREVSK